MDAHDVETLTDRLRAEVRKVVVGQDAILDLLIVALLSDGHVLMEGVPGVAKTLIAQCFARTLALEYGRVQFTPDLMPGDVTGTNIFNFQTNSFSLNRGPIFTQILLADEINRAPPKTQAALLQAMNERAVTIDGTEYPLGAGFMVLATQNPIEQQGTYPLPEAQLDRFLFKLTVPFPTREQEIEIVARHGQRSTWARLDDFGVTAVADQESLQAMRAAVERVTLTKEIGGYIVDIVRATRGHAQLDHGASPRAAVHLATASRARAILEGRSYVIPDDAKDLAVPLLRHRVMLSAAAMVDGILVDRVIEQILEQTPAPR